MGSVHDAASDRMPCDTRLPQPPGRAADARPEGASHAMSSFDPSRIQWREPWFAVTPDDALKIEAELRREVCARHLLFGRSVTAVGRRRDRDDVLFYLGESAPSVAVVHLTYRRETQPGWPDTTLFDTLAAWMEQCMIPDAEESAS